MASSIQRGDESPSHALFSGKYCNRWYEVRTANSKSLLFSPSLSSIPFWLQGSSSKSRSSPVFRYLRHCELRRCLVHFGYDKTFWRCANSVCYIYAKSRIYSHVLSLVSEVDYYEAHLWASFRFAGYIFAFFKQDWEGSAFASILASRHLLQIEVCR